MSSTSLPTLQLPKWNLQNLQKIPTKPENLRNPQSGLKSPSLSLSLPTSISTLPWPPSTKTLHYKIEERFVGSRSFQCELGKVPSSILLSSVRRRLDLPLVVDDVLLPSPDVSVAGTERNEMKVSKQGTTKEGNEGTKERSERGDPTLVKLT